MFSLPIERELKIVWVVPFALYGAESASNVGTEPNAALANKIATLVIGPMLVTLVNERASTIREVTFSVTIEALNP